MHAYDINGDGGDGTEVELDGGDGKWSIVGGGSHHGCCRGCGCSLVKK